jgi:hypothetical protein
LQPAGRPAAGGVPRRVIASRSDAAVAPRRNSTRSPPTIWSRKPERVRGQPGPEPGPIEEASELGADRSVPPRFDAVGLGPGAHSSLTGTGGERDDARVVSSYAGDWLGAAGLPSSSYRPGEGATEADARARPCRGAPPCCSPATGRPAGAPYRGGGPPHRWSAAGRGDDDEGHGHGHGHEWTGEGAGRRAVRAGVCCCSRAALGSAGGGGCQRWPR